MASLPEGFEYRSPESITIWDYEDLSPETIGVLLDHKGEVMKVIEQPRRRLGYAKGDD